MCHGKNKDCWELGMSTTVVVVVVVVVVIKLLYKPTTKRLIN